jgi:hypothetical protein
VNRGLRLILKKRYPAEEVSRIVRRRCGMDYSSEALPGRLKLSLPELSVTEPVQRLNIRGIGFENLLEKRFGLGKLLLFKPLFRLPEQFGCRCLSAKIRRN